jgi:hypothetical protein
MFPGSQHFGGRGACWSSMMRIRKIDKQDNYLHRHAQNQTTSSLVRSLSTFGARTNHKQTRTHKTHHNLELGEATTFPFIVFFVPNHGANTQMSFCPVIPKLGLPQFWRPITLYEDFQLKWSLKQSCSLHWELSNNMWHATYTQENWGNFQLLMVRSQIANLTLDPSFGHNLYFKYPNESCEPILDIYVPSIFQWYK